MLILVILVFSVCSLIFLFLKWNQDYWEKRNIPGPKPSLLFGNMSNFFKKRNITYDFDDIYKFVNFLLFFSNVF